MTEMEENSKTKGNRNMNMKDKEGNTALHIAVKSGHVDVLETLLKLGVRIDEKNNKGETGLFIAVSQQMEEAVRCLVKNGGDIWAEDEEGTSVWHAAAYSGNSVILDILANRLLESNREKSEAGVPGHVENTEDIDISSGGKINENIKEDSVALVEYEDHKEKKDVNSVSQTVHTLKNSEFKTSDLSGTKQCDANGVISSSSNFPEKGRKENCKSEAGIPKTYENKCQFTEDEEKNFDKRKVSGGLNGLSHEDFDDRHKCSKNIANKTGTEANLKVSSKCLQEAEETVCSKISDNEGPKRNRNITRYDSEVLKRKENFNINEKDNRKQMCVKTKGRYKPLDVSESESEDSDGSLGFRDPQEEKMRKKWKRHFDKTNEFNVKDDRGSSTLHLAAGCGSLRAVRLLLKMNCGTEMVNSVNNFGMTPVMMAAACGSVKVIRALYKAGADLNMTDKTGSTALHTAVFNERLKACRELINLGINKDIKDYFGNTALHLAKNKRLLPFVQLLKPSITEGEYIFFDVISELEVMAFLRFLFLNN